MLDDINEILYDIVIIIWGISYNGTHSVKQYQNNKLMKTRV